MRPRAGSRNFSPPAIVHRCASFRRWLIEAPEREMAAAPKPHLWGRTNMGHGSNDAEGLEEASPNVRPSRGEKWSGIYELAGPAWDVPPTIGVSERAAEVAHGVKNAVHSLRGLATLLESRVSHCPRALEI